MWWRNSKTIIKKQCRSLVLKIIYNSVKDIQGNNCYLVSNNSM